jgi:hypothetical protein
MRFCGGASYFGLACVVRVDGARGADGGASRRMVYLALACRVASGDSVFGSSYILWIAASSTTFLLAYLVVLNMGIFESSVQL